MGWQRLVASIVDSLAWPAGVAFVAWLLRAELRGLVGRIKALHWKDATAEFAEATERTLDEVRELTSDDVGTGVETETVTAEDVAKAFEASPENMVLASWEFLLSALRDVAGSRGLPYTDDRSPARLLTQLRRAQAIPEPEMAAIEELRILRNRAAHGEPVTARAGRSYAEAVDLVVSKLRHPIIGGRHLADDAGQG